MTYSSEARPMDQKLRTLKMQIVANFKKFPYLPILLFDKDKTRLYTTNNRANTHSDTNRPINRNYHHRTQNIKNKPYKNTHTRL